MVQDSSDFTLKKEAPKSLIDKKKHVANWIKTILGTERHIEGHQNS